MKFKNEVFSINALIVIITLTGFIFTLSSFCISFEKLFCKDIETVSRVISENIHSQIANMLDIPLTVSVSMAHDTFLTNYLKNEMSSAKKAENTAVIKNYLATYQKKYKFDSFSLVEEKTLNYYHHKRGLDRVLDPNAEEDRWYFDFIKGDKSYAFNVDNDRANKNFITVFVNSKIKDKDETLGIAAVGIKTPHLQEFLAKSEKLYDARIYLINSQGDIEVSSNLTRFDSSNLFKDPFFASVKEAIQTISDKPVGKWYQSEKIDAYIITRYVPSLNWYLVVVKDTNQFTKAVYAQLLKSGLFSFICLILVILTITTVIYRHHKTALALSQRDTLTNVRNRTSYTYELMHMEKNIKTFESFAIGIFDLNNLKMTNDIHGHQVGDTLIRDLSMLICKTFSNSPVFRIGGDEFVVLLVEMKKDQIEEKWGQLQNEFVKYNSTHKIKLTSAFGYAFYDNEKLNSTSKIFKAADDAMYSNKQNWKVLGTEE
ncbi:MAG: diguanylate cyclase [Synergistaceae bacterium]